MESKNELSRGHATLNILPSAGNIVSAFSDPVPARKNLIVGAATELMKGNLEQWRIEDRCRDFADDDAVVAECKRAIDQLNGRRVKLVELIDGLAFEAITADVTAVPHTETLGHLIDRLSVAWVRFNQLAHHGTSDAATRAELQLQDLCSAYDYLISDVQNGRRHFPNWNPLKSYGSTGRDGSS